MGTDSRFKSTNHWSPPWHTLSRSTPFNLVGELPVWTHPHNPFRPRWCSTTNWMGELDFNIITDLLRSVWWKHNLSPPSAYAERSIFSHVQGGMKSSRARSRLDFAVFYGTNAFVLLVCLLSKVCYLLTIKNHCIQNRFQYFKYVKKIFFRSFATVGIIVN